VYLFLLISFKRNTQFCIPWSGSPLFKFFAIHYLRLVIKYSKLISLMPGRNQIRKFLPPPPYCTSFQAKWRALSCSNRLSAAVGKVRSLFSVSSNSVRVSSNPANAYSEILSSWFPFTLICNSTCATHYYTDIAHTHLICIHASQPPPLRNARRASAGDYKFYSLSVQRRLFIIPSPF